MPNALGAIELPFVPFCSYFGFFILVLERRDLGDWNSNRGIPRVRTDIRDSPFSKLFNVVQNPDTPWGSFFNNIVETGRLVSVRTWQTDIRLQASMSGSVEI